MKLSILFILLSISSFVSLSQLDIKHLQGSWFLKDIKQVPNSPIKVDAEELQFEIEGMQEGYIHITSNTIDFYNFDGDFEQDLADGLEYIYNSSTKIISLKFKDSDEKVDVKYKLLELSATHMVYQSISSDYIANYHFVRATPEQLIVGGWSVSDLSIEAYIAKLPVSEREAALQLQEIFQIEFSLMYLDLHIDKTGYIEAPDGAGEVATAELTWSLNQNVLKLSYEDGNAEDVKVISIKHNELILEIPIDGVTIVLTLNRNNV